MYSRCWHRSGFVLVRVDIVYPRYGMYVYVSKRFHFFFSLRIYFLNFPIRIFKNLKTIKDVLNIEMYFFSLRWGRTAACGVGTVSSGSRWILGIYLGWACYVNFQQDMSGYTSCLPHRGPATSSSSPLLSSKYFSSHGRESTPRTRKSTVPPVKAKENNRWKHIFTKSEWIFVTIGNWTSL